MGGSHSATEPVDAKEFANLLLDWADEINVLITPMKLQKLLYYCHSDFLLSTGNELISEDFEAWQYGPVIASVFQEFKIFSLSPITSRASRFNPITAKRIEAKPADLGQFASEVRSIFESYVHLSASVLSRMSHIESGPWHEALAQFERGRNMGKRISNDLIRAHHRLDRTSISH
jgi:uncharacterized phage-associated protein